MKIKLDLVKNKIWDDIEKSHLMPLLFSVGAISGTTFFVPSNYILTAEYLLPNIKQVDVQYFFIDI